MSGYIAQNPGCAILLVDESAAMESPLTDKQQIGIPLMPQLKSAAVATAINALLSQLGAGPDFDIAIVGYRTDSDGNPAIGPRWIGPLSESEFVRTSQLAENCDSPPLSDSGRGSGYAAVAGA